MKTAEEYLKEKNITPETKHHNYDYVYHSVFGAIEQAQKDAFKEGQSNPKIKQLEWDFYGTYYTTSRMEYSIKTPFIIYVIMQGDDYNINENEYLLWIDGVSYNFRTLDKAKAAAQRDFERRVRECLDL